MSKKFTDFSQLSKGLVKLQKAEEKKPEPQAAASDDEDVLAYFSRAIGGGAAQRRSAVAANGADESAASEATAELRSLLEARNSELAAVAREKDEALARADCLERNLKDCRAALVSAESEAARLRNELARLQEETSERREVEKEVVAVEGDIAGGEVDERSAHGMLAADIGVSEVFPGEIREHVLATLAEGRDAALRSGRERRVIVLNGVLAANHPNGGLEMRRARLKQAMKDAGAFIGANTLSELEQLGFRCISGKKHWKLEFGGVRIPIAKTPSDRRAGLNTSANIANLCF